MRAILERLKYNGLFVKMFVIMVVSIISVTLLTSWVTIRMSERLFMNTFSITNSKVITQIKTNFESFNYAVITAANNVLQSGSIKGFLSQGDGDSGTIETNRIYFTAIQLMKQYQANLDAYDVGMTIIGANGRSYTSDNTVWPIPKNQLRTHPITINTNAEPKRVMYQFSGGTPDSLNPVIVATKALYERTSGTLYGDLYIAIRETAFKRFYTNFTSDGNDVVILNRSGVIVSSNRDDLIGKLNVGLLSFAKQIEEEGLPYKNASVMGGEYVLLAEYLPTYDFYVVNLVDKETALEQLVNTRAVALICAAIVLVALLIVFVISKRLTRSLSLLVRQMSNVTKKNFHNYINVKGSFEVKELGYAYNYMLDELNDYVKRLVETQREQHNAELAALQMQINPHFLYNTLASIKILVQQGSKEKASDTINALISLLQNTIGNVSETVTVSDEIENLKHYVFINHMRYGERIKVSYFVAPDCLDVRVPKLILQPFMENAFFHAFNDKPDGYIYVLVSAEAGSLLCEIVDNGSGIEGLSDNGKLPNPKGGRQLFSGIGIRNVHDRIVLLYGNAYGVVIDSKPGEGTKVRIRMPLL
ncbi:two-component system sensor histidine kinase YesM [Paenibacillus cellulosilyticus]|uniref:Two-component system sensor histidine kinase YesM n=1 Tax=Paenibacillus cellulosilyticus TaxID=375489 RepID=A0A2V2YS32_9BACL|nr:sensor histidine kinase [Paenibacillus cellulosilyticus]PWV98387.1 two-component system sensor histidine kinase YesM [Paenibacillus cellulosilyticus]QKS43237.1 sensor histidine kinase [Paenibacillus cellulosilyticus]